MDNILFARLKKYINGVALGQGAVQIPGNDGMGVPSGGFITGNVWYDLADTGMTILDAFDDITAKAKRFLNASIYINTDHLSSPATLVSHKSFNVPSGVVHLSLSAKEGFGCQSIVTGSGELRISGHKRCSFASDGGWRSGTGMMALVNFGSVTFGSQFVSMAADCRLNLYDCGKVYLIDWFSGSPGSRMDVYQSEIWLNEIGPFNLAGSGNAIYVMDRPIPPGSTVTMSVVYDLVNKTITFV